MKQVRDQGAGVPKSWTSSDRWGGWPWNEVAVSDGAFREAGVFLRYFQRCFLAWSAGNALIHVVSASAARQRLVLGQVEFLDRLRQRLG